VKGLTERKKKGIGREDAAENFWNGIVAGRHINVSFN
jgi:hypothetical protein